MSEREEFDWTLLMKFGLGALGLAPRDFWRMTPAEFDAAVKGKFGQFDEVVGMSQAKLSALAAKFPDERRAP